MTCVLFGHMVAAQTISRASDGAEETGTTETVIVRASASPTPSTSPSWLRYLDAYRASAGLGRLTVDTEWSADAALHAHYTVNEDVLGHSQNTSSRWYTPQGDHAARNSNVMASSSSTATDEYAIDRWMEGPFHALGIIDPRLRRTGFGTSTDSSGRYHMAATLDVIRGRSAPPRGVDWPILWPADGRQVPIGRYTGNEHPNPLSGCEGYAAPSGLPVIAQFGSGTANPVVTASAFLRNGVPVEHCVFTESTYANADAKAEAFGRAVLASRDAVVLIPRQPLVRGERYTASLTVGGVEHRWSFTIGTFDDERWTETDHSADAATHAPSASRSRK